MSLLEICDVKPATVPIESTVEQAIRVMLRESVGAVAVVDSEGIVAGIFTERDVLEKLALSGLDPAKLPVRELMTTPVEMATEETSEAEAFAVMMVRHYRHLPVVDAAGKLLGMLSIRHVLQAQMEDLVRQLNAAKTG
ncbi:MAG: CBS domain-containing protein [Terriglobales bacterium]